MYVLVFLLGHFTICVAEGEESPLQCHLSFFTSDTRVSELTCKWHNCPATPATCMSTLMGHEKRAA